MEEMDDCLGEVLEDVGPLLILLSKNIALRQMVDVSLSGVYDGLTQAKPKLLLHNALYATAKSQSSCLAFR